ncbi:MAG: hypothetical protein ACK5T6_08650, partial [Pirellula sp.]
MPSVDLSVNSCVEQQRIDACTYAVMEVRCQDWINVDIKNADIRNVSFVASRHLDSNMSRTVISFLSSGHS